MGISDLSWSHGWSCGGSTLVEPCVVGGKVGVVETKCERVKIFE